MGGIIWLPVCDRQYDYLLVSRFIREGEQNYARPVFASLFLAAKMFAMPEIGIANHEARNRGWKRRWSGCQLVIIGG